MFEEIFCRRKHNADKLLDYGFVMAEEFFRYETEIMDGAFLLEVMINKNGQVDTQLLERESGEPYVLYKTMAEGSFVGEVRREIGKALQEIAIHCYDSSVLRFEQTLQIIEYVRKTYGDELEFLWPKFSDNAIWRRKDNRKWYAVILTIAKSKLGFDSDEPVEVIDLRLQPEKMKETVDYQKYFPGWHMNKRSWYTIILDGSVSTEEIAYRMDESYRLAKK